MKTVKGLQVKLEGNKLIFKTASGAIARFTVKPA